MTTEKYFPLLWERRERAQFPAAPSFLPWDIVEPHREAAMMNHDQTLERLAERGGLSPVEFYMVARGLRWGIHAAPVDTKQALEFIDQLLTARHQSQGSSKSS